MAKKRTPHTRKGHVSLISFSLSLPLNSCISAFPDCSTSSSHKVSPCWMFYWVFPSYSHLDLCICLLSWRLHAFTNNSPAAWCCRVYIYPSCCYIHLIGINEGTISPLKINQRMTAARVHWDRDMSRCTWTCQHSDIYVAAATLTCTCWEAFIGDLLTAVPGKTSSVSVCTHVCIWPMFRFIDS